MSYRDETLALRETLAALETERATLAGRVRGLELREAELSERAATVRATLASMPRALTVRRAGGRVAGTVAGLVGLFFLFGGGCIACAALGDYLFGAIDLEAVGEVVTSDLAGVSVGERCGLAVAHEDRADELCRARFGCGGRALYDGVASCAQIYDDDLVVYWDHAPEAQDGTPRLVVSETDRAVVLWTAGGTVEVELLRRP